MPADPSTTVIIVNAALTFFLTGVVWTVQAVHYPFFAFVHEDRFPDAHAFHTGRITPVVAPAMIAELLTSVWLVFRPPRGASGYLLAAGLALVVIVWISTFFIQVPSHGRLAGRFSVREARRLVAGNWVRTAAWSLKSLAGVASLLLLVERL